ncbi:T9SS type B sorting domain-containing protein [Sphingobacterium paucimobilis]|nr:gliding motility-associated C-terminal domain-containing protein [Sphingobacterium paucimobilis]
MKMKWNMLLLMGLFCWMNSVFGEGSKDLYPDKVEGNRAFLVSLPVGRDAFANRAAHYVYAVEGETIAVASSAQNIGQGRIWITSPDGIQYQTDANDVGRIVAMDGSSRKAELAGPRIGYTPFEVPVGMGQTGIWSIEFRSPDDDPRSIALTEVPSVKADADWTQHRIGSLIAAWDVSVRNRDNTAWLAGRVFVSILQLHISRESLAQRDGAFYGQNYVLTNDGYIYHVNGNGSHGVDFAYFVNSSGILDRKGTPTYKSANQQSVALFHNPNEEDQGLHVTHKMFYNLPDSGMPKESQGAFPGGKSWLFNTQQVISVQDIGIVRENGAGNQLRKEGTFLSFQTNCKGRYKVVISSKSTNILFANREITVEAKEGVNRFFWDGLDGDGRFVPEGTNYSIGISVSLIKGEIHFPYFDMEINPNGIIVDRINIDGSTHSDAVMFWDDSDITGGQPSEVSRPRVNKVGTPSRVDGHRWGTYRETEHIQGTTNNGYGAFSYGNDRVMDTWTYASLLQAEVVETISVGEKVPVDEGEAFPEVKEQYITLYQGKEAIFDLVVERRNDATPTKIEIVDSPVYGQLVLTGTTATYTVTDATYVGTDEFSYRLAAEGDTAKVANKVYLQILRTAPVAKDDSFEIVYNTAQVLDITNNDFVEHTYLDKESIRILEYPSQGNLYKDADGGWIYEAYDQYVGTDRFTYQIKDGNGNWSNIATVTLQVKGLFIPNTITPNGDSKNDTFEIIGLSVFDQVEVSVLDRTGRIIFASSNYKNDWIVPSSVTNGVYFYVFKGSRYGQRPVVNKGALMILTSATGFAK